MLRNIGYVIGGILFLLFLYYALFALPLAVQDAPQPDPNDPDQLGAVGEYLGYLVGVPAAIGGALAAVAIALNTDAVAKRQLQLEAAKYRDAKTEEIKVNIREFAEQLQHLRKNGTHLGIQIDKVRLRSASTAAFLAAVEEDEAACQAYARLEESFDDLSRAILKLASNEIVHACVEGQRESTRNKIRDAVQSFWGEKNKFDFNRDILDIREQIDFLRLQRNVKDAAAASLLMPPDSHTLDFLGAYIKIADCQDRLASELMMEQALHEGDELINFGIALIASLYQLLPSDQMITDTIARIYEIRDLKLRPVAPFKAREVYFSRTTLEVVNEAIDGGRLFLQVVSEDIVGGKGVSFHDEARVESRRAPRINRIAALMRR